MEIIRMERVSVTVKDETGDKLIFSDLHISVDRGEKVLIRGRSGIGKTTVFRLILGFTRPSSGGIYFEGRRADPDLFWEVRKRTAHISQDSDIGEGPVMALFGEVFSYSANRGKFSRDDLGALLLGFSLQEDVLTKKFENLSGGEKQRIAIIISLMTKKDIFLLDEITSDLDAALKEKVVDFFLARPEWTVLVISHDPEWEREGVRIIDFAEVVSKTKVGKHAGQ
ncbi:ABC transporter ATP-binding protein [Methanolobus halotolerans]|uniref:ABC transporter ATP-binding protein n=1 Tax=Methanolobus halotolerans TaxID=2052935 RepID=A0A4E0PYM2_9EURY|nr:ATP-binding cassette domain-containing protein [Methanolobus halotolerans]TGC10620.1 ABC transporter ATP-binding protein [Methanolobus halotolerans]